MRFLYLAALTLSQVMIADAAFAGVTPTPVPEPATMALLAVGIGGIAVVRQFRKRK